jgi:NADPH:quinone reductase-like Zn-dependent oxidoreductase
VKAAYYSENGGPDVLRYGDVPDPEIGPNDVLIRVQAVSVEGGDVLHRRMVPPSSQFHVGGYQAGGVVEAVGGDVTTIRPGQRVAAHNDRGSHAELFAVPESLCFPLPDGLDMDVGSTLPVTFGTAHDALFEFGGLRAGETVLVQGAAGGVGIACVQLAKRAGATVVGTASGTQRLERLAALGMDHGIDYREQDIAQSVMELTDGRGADLVIDMAGGTSLAPLLGGMAYRGRLALTGMASGAMPSVSFADLVPRNLTVMGVLLAREIHGPRVHRIVAEIMEQVRAGDLTMPIDSIFPLSDAATAHRHVEQGHPFGRVLLHP